MNKPRIVRTGGDTGFATAAFMMMHQNNTAAIMDMTGAARTTINTRRIITVVTAF
jgi:hypothetical protein